MIKQNHVVVHHEKYGARYMLYFSKQIKLMFSAQ